VRRWAKVAIALGAVGVIVTSIWQLTADPGAEPAWWSTVLCSAVCLGGVVVSRMPAAQGDRSEG